MFKRSQLLYWAVITVGARESPNLKGLFTTAQANTIDLLRQTVAGPPVSYWDLCGAMVYNKWLSPIRPIGEDIRCPTGATLIFLPGHIVDMAYELGLHRTFANIADKRQPLPSEVRDVRLWVTITIQDYL